MSTTMKQLALALLLPLLGSGLDHSSGARHMEVGFAPRSLVRMEQRLAVDEHGASKYKSKAEKCGDQKKKDKCLDTPLCHWEENKDKCVIDDCESGRHDSEDDCKKKWHCEWTDDKCKWVETKECGEVKKEPDCKSENHCKWGDDACKWVQDDKECNDMDGKEDECKLRGDCKWDGDKCKNKDAGKCEDFNGEEDACKDRGNCTWNDNKCKNTECKDFNSSNETCDDHSECMWHRDMCKNKTDERKCSEVKKEDACEEGMKCEWKDGDCKEEPFFQECQKHDKKGDCEGKSDCRWLDNACYPKADAGAKNDEPPNMNEREAAREDCHVLKDETSCLDNPSCYWWKEGNPKCELGLLCSQFDKDACKELDRCKWEDGKACMEANPDD